MSEVSSLRDVVEVHGRFHRSVRLNQDWKERGDLGGYLLTPTARELATRMTQALSETGGTRAWSVTGPYGSGKSAFALFLADLLAHDPPNHTEGRNLRHDLRFTVEPFPCVGGWTACAPKAGAPEGARRGGEACGPGLGR